MAAAVPARVAKRHAVGAGGVYVAATARSPENYVGYRRCIADVPSARLRQKVRGA